MFPLHIGHSGEPEVASSSRTQALHSLFTHLQIGTAERSGLVVSTYSATSNETRVPGTHRFNSEVQICKFTSRQTPLSNFSCPAAAYLFDRMIKIDLRIRFFGFNNYLI